MTPTAYMADFTKKSEKNVPDEHNLLSWHKAVLVRVAEVTIANGQNVL